MRVLAILFGLLAGTSCALAAAPTATPGPQDFAYGVPLEVDGDGAIYSLELPEVVYRHVTRRDLGDLRVFNSNNRVVPHLLRRQKEDETVTREPVALKLFPLYREAGEAGTPNIPRVHIVTDNSGTIIDISGSTPATGEQRREVYAYVVDLGPALEPEGQGRPDWLEFDWQGAPASFATRVAISASDDLDNWRVVNRSTTLSHFRFAGNELQRRRVELNGLHARYLRISWPAGREGVVLSAIRAGYGETLRESQRRWAPLSQIGPRVREEGGRVHFDYDAAAMLPIDRLRLKVGNDNSVANVRVFSRGDNEAPWRQVYSGVIYRLTVQGEQVENPVVRIATTQDRYWRIELGESEAAATGDVILEAGWRPHQLLFMASGEAPFRIAYGAVGVAPARSAIPELLRQLGEDGEAGFVKTAQAGAEIELGGEGQLAAPREIPWRRILLWAVLVLGVAVVAFMVLRLVREMKTAD